MLENSAPDLPKGTAELLLDRLQKQYEGD